MRQFSVAHRSLESLEAQTAARLVTAAADIALVIDDHGIIRDIAFGTEEFARGGHEKWLGQLWLDTVTVESRAKVVALLDPAQDLTPPRRRQINHSSLQGAGLPVLYSAVRLGASGDVVAIGRDLRPVAALQQRLVDAQQSMERDYWKMRHVETRYRLLFQGMDEAVLIVDAATQRVVEANAAAGALLNQDPAKLIGRTFPDGLDADATHRVQSLFAAARGAGRGDDVQVQGADGVPLRVAALLFRQENASMWLVRLADARIEARSSLGRPKTWLLQAIERAPDAFIVTDIRGRILSANAAFRDLAQLADDAPERSQSLDRWLGRTPVDFDVLVANLKQHGSVRLFATVLRGEQGGETDVEVSAVSVMAGDPPCLGFAIRDVGRRLSADPVAGRALPRTEAQVTELVGRLSLKDIVRESTDLIERLCIEAALELTGDNRASAAELLGLSRQSLYVKLRRFGLPDPSPQPER